MNKAIFVFLAIMLIATLRVEAAGDVKTRVNVSGVKGSAGVDVQVEYRAEDGASGNELRFIRGNGSVTFRIPAHMTNVLVEARLEDCRSRRAFKRFSSPPASVDLRIP
jgi:hypothetical protein